MTPAPATPAVGVYAEASLPDDAASRDASLGGAGSLAVSTGAGFFVEADLLGGPALGGGFTGAGWLGVRYHLGGRAFDAVPSMSLFAGGGGALEGDARAGFVLGAAADLAARNGLAPRLAVDWLASPWQGDHAVVLRLGIAAIPGRTPHDDGPPVVAPVPVEPAPVAAPAAPAPATPPSLVVADAPPGTMVWLRHPYCAWVPLDDVQGYLDRANPPVPASVHARGFLPAVVDLDGATKVALVQAPPQGTVVIVATPGDDVRVGGAPVALAEDGTAFVQVLQGVVVVNVVGGGRATALEVAAEPGYAAFVRVPDAAPFRVAFAQGSAVVSAAARRELAPRVGWLAEHRLRVLGSYSVEGDLDANRALATARAVAVRDALVALGVPAARIEVGEPQAPDPSLSPEDQRAAVVVPLPAKAP